MWPILLFGRGLRWKRSLVGAYVAALLAFQLTERTDAPKAPAGTVFVTVPAVDGARRTADAVSVAYRDFPETAGESATPLVLLHGSPGSGSVFDGLVDGLRGSRRIVVPDLPGFGSSTASLPDYSFRAHAVYVAELLDRLRIRRAHVLAFSMGGGVGLTMADSAPAKVASLILLSAIGVQEMELLGQYHVNHAVHGAQLVALWALANLVPGVGPLAEGRAYARNFYDSDQRPLRQALRRLDGPVLIVHGRQDPLVPVEAAVEHARIVPQAELVILEGDHFMTFEDPARLAPIVRRFLNQVDRGVAPTRSQASPARLVQSSAPFDPAVIPRVRVLSAVAGVGLLASVALVVAPMAWLVRAGAAYRARRLLVSRWRRATRWEYWPPWITYAPVACYVLWLMARHRSVTAFTAANTGILAGGVVGESKIEILRGLGRGSHVAAAEFLAGDLPLNEKQAAVDRFMRAHHLSLPVVIKPDAGQRGSGVVVVRTPAELVGALKSSCVDTIVQEYVAGEEFGVFYYRRPSEPTGHILSITRKHLPVVIGDGTRTVEHLILDDDRAVCMARFHLTQQRARLHQVPRAGETVSLGDCGSHCRGATFLDGAALGSDALAAAIDSVARGFPGFFFGRFDLRVPSAAALTDGRDFTVLELNGVTSEATHIYDPAISVFAAYRALFEQWRLAFEIGAENVSRGAGTTSLLDLVRLAFEYRRRARLHLRA